MHRNRVFLLMGLLLLFLLLLLIRLFYFQVVRGQEISKKVIEMHSQGIDMRELPRGEILDRHLIPLTGNHSAYALYCLPQNIYNNSSKESSYRELARSLATSLNCKNENEIYNTIEKASQNGTAVIRLYSDLTPAQIERIQADHCPALVVAPVYKRYREDGFLAHLLGYAIKGTDTEKIEGTGLEKAYYDQLSRGGSQQKLLTLLDARGKTIPGLSIKVKSETTPGNAVVLTIDKRVQELVEKTMNQRVAKGAVVVMDVKSKEILAMASRPTYKQYQVEEYLSDIESPLINRVLTPYYPGSLFKIALSIAALEDDIVNPVEIFNCKGKYTFNDQVAISCWKKEGHGDLSFEQAFANSCNPTFIKVGLRLGKSRLLNYVEALHLTDVRLGGLDQMQSGTYVQIDGGKIALGNACLGQQGVMVTPLQIASLLATVADNGSWAPPAVVRYTLDGEGRQQNLHLPAKAKLMGTETAKKVQRMMEMVVEEGTGQTAGLTELKVAGKTATSQTGKLKENGEEILNTWFAGYLPAEAPRWVIVVLVEEGQSGAQNCAPVFKDICKGMLKLMP